MHFRENNEAAHPDPYENINIFFPIKSFCVSIKLMSPVYKDPVYMFPNSFDNKHVGSTLLWNRAAISYSGKCFIILENDFYTILWKGAWKQ